MSITRVEGCAVFSSVLLRAIADVSRHWCIVCHKMEGIGYDVSRSELQQTGRLQGGQAFKAWRVTFWAAGSGLVSLSLGSFCRGSSWST